MSRGPQSSLEQRRRVQQLVLEGYKATEIHRMLEDEDLLSDPHPALVLRTIQRMVSKITPHDESGPWSLRDATSDEVRVVLEVLVDMFERTEGRVWLTKEVARWIVKIRAASPLLPSIFVYVYARMYQAVGMGDTRQLDLMVGLGIRPRPKESQDKIFQGMWDAGILPGVVGNIDLDIPWPGVHPPSNPDELSIDSNLTAKPADAGGQEETNHPEE